MVGSSKAVPALTVVLAVALLVVASSRLHVHVTWERSLQPNNDEALYQYLTPHRLPRRLPPVTEQNDSSAGTEPVESFQLPQDYTPVVSQPCLLQPNLPPEDGSGVLEVAGPINGHGNTQRNSQGCWQSCKDTPGCVAWYWCDQREGCVDFDWRKYPYKGCELRKREVVRRLGQPPDSPRHRMPTFAIGYLKPIIPAEQVGAFTINEIGNKLPAKSAGGLVLVSSMNPDPCGKEQGDLIYKLSINNKIDYARLHGFEYHLYTRPVDKSLVKMYTKVGVMRKVLSDTSRERAEWVLWIDVDTIIQELAFQMPFHLYRLHNKSFVTVGDEDWVQAGDQWLGVNSGIMLFENIDLNRDFWKDVARVSRININVAANPNTEEGMIKAELEDQVQISGDIDALHDQNVIIYVLRVHAQKYMPQTFFEERYCVSCWIKGVFDIQSHAPFVNHFASCKFCHESSKQDKDNEEAIAWASYCRKEWFQHYGFANRTTSMLLGCEEELVQWGPPFGQPVNGWFDCSEKRGQPMCPALPAKRRAGKRQQNGKRTAQEQQT